MHKIILILMLIVCSVYTLADDITEGNLYVDDNAYVNNTIVGDTIISRAGYSFNGSGENLTDLNVTGSMINYNTTTLENQTGNILGINQTWLDSLYARILDTKSWISGNYTNLDNKINTMPNVTMQEINDSQGNWSLDKGSYSTILYVASIGNWTADKIGYYTSTQTDTLFSTLPNLTYSDIAVSIGNWSFDKDSLPNLTMQDINDSFGNWSQAQSSYTTIVYVTSIGNFTAWGYNYDDMINIPTHLSNFTNDLSFATEAYVDTTGNWTADKGNYINTTTLNNGTIIREDNITWINQSGLILNWSNIIITTGDNTTFNQTLTDGLYTNQTYVDGQISGIVNLTLGEIVTNIGNWTSDKSSYAPIVYVDGQIGGIVNLTEADVVTAVGNWTADQGNYYTSTQTDTLFTALPNLTMQDINDSFGNWSQAQSSYTTIVYVTSIGNFTAWGYNYDDMINIPTHLSNFTNDLSFATEAYVDTTGNWTADKGNYINTTTLNNGTIIREDNITWINQSGLILNWSNIIITTGDNTTFNQTLTDGLYTNQTYVDGQISGIVNLTLGEIVTNIGNWTSDKGSYYTSTQTDTLFTALPNLTESDVVTAVGNWTADKSSYATITYTDGQIDGLINLTEADVITIVDGSGNWTADKGSYTTTTYVDAEIDGIVNISYTNASFDLSQISNTGAVDIGTYNLTTGGNFTVGEDIILSLGQRVCFDITCTGTISKNTTGVYIVFDSIERIKINSSHTVIS